MGQPPRLSVVFGAICRCLGAGFRGLRGQEGATTAEYALLLALVVIVLISTLSELGDVLQDKLSLIISQLRDAS